MDSLLMAVNANTGELLWTVDQKNPWVQNPNTPLYENGLLFTSTGGGIGSVQLRLTNGGRSMEQVWTNTLDSKTGGYVKVGNHVYGSGEKSRYWHCIDWKTGESLYKDNKLSSGTVIAADGMLYCYSDRGELALVKPSPEKFDIVSRFKVTLGTGNHIAHLVIYKGTLYVRHGTALMAYKI
jgi:outer membrane protein assembly factor BamB